MALSDSIDRLKSQLLTSGLSQKNQALFQVINQLIGINSDLAAQLEALTGGGSGGGTVSTSQSILTLQDEQGTLPNSRKLNVQSGATMMTNGKQTFVGSSPIPMGVEELHEEYFMLLPGTQSVALGPKAVSTPYVMIDDKGEDDVQEPPPLYSLQNINSIPEAAIADGTILARVASNESINGNWTFNANVAIAALITQSAATPQYIINDSTGAADAKSWRWIQSAGVMYLQTINDAFSAFNTIYSISRSGVTPTIFDLTCVLALSGRSAVSLTADQTAWNPTGLGSVSYFYITPTAPGWIIKGITAQAAGTIIILVNSSVDNITINHEDAGASASNRILLGSAVAKNLLQYNSMTLIYDGTLSRWVCIGRST